ncbi:hypothetical protein BSKO_09646 [Bryopsis sp. KO-2023]|nr:hypothetical protein BSKO_09646 [Bryopsis sp. KO-2023]
MDGIFARGANAPDELSNKVYPEGVIISFSFNQYDLHQAFSNTQISTVVFLSYQIMPMCTAVNSKFSTSISIFFPIFFRIRNQEFFKVSSSSSQLRFSTPALSMFVVSFSSVISHFFCIKYAFMLSTLDVIWSILNQRLLWPLSRNHKFFELPLISREYPAAGFSENLSFSISMFKKDGKKNKLVSLCKHPYQEFVYFYFKLPGNLQPGEVHQKCSFVPGGILSLEGLLLP